MDVLVYLTFFSTFLHIQLVRIISLNINTIWKVQKNKSEITFTHNNYLLGLGFTYQLKKLLTKLSSPSLLQQFHLLNSSLNSHGKSHHPLVFHSFEFVALSETTLWPSHMSCLLQLMHIGVQVVNKGQPYVVLLLPCITWTALLEVLIESIGVWLSCSPPAAYMSVVHPTYCNLQTR